MYKYTTQPGWKTESASGGIHHPIRPVPTPFLESSGHLCESSEELEERDDVPAPLPPSSITNGVTLCHRSDVGEGVTGTQCHRGDVGEGVTVVDGLVATDKTQVKNSSGNGGGKVLFAAKDKRKLREKRRSTGIAKFNASELQDGETVNNTSYNETSSGSHYSTALPSIPASPENLPELALTSDVIHNNVTTSDEPTSITGTPLNGLTHDQNTLSNSHHIGGSPESCISTSEAPASGVKNDVISDRTSLPEVSATEPSSGYLKPCMKRPPVATKPGIAAKPAARILGAHNSGPPSQFQMNTAVKARSGPTEAEILTREIEDLKKMLEAEKTNNAALQKQLSERDERIKELTIEVMALNEDLDVADEDYIQLEQENNALLQAMAQLTLGASDSS